MEFRNIVNFAISSFVIFALVAFIPIFYLTFIVFSTTLVGIQLAEWLMTVTRKYILWETVSPKNKAVLITGYYIFCYSTDLLKKEIIPFFDI